MTFTNNNNIYPKSCVYDCNTQIYWNVATNEYWEVFTKKKHICPNRSSKNKLATSNTTATTLTNRPTYYNKKSWSHSQQPKPKMSNSFEYLQGSIAEIQKKYEVLSDLVTEHNDKVHGSQSHIISANSISLIVYYEVPLGNREEVKRKFDNFRI